MNFKLRFPRGDIGKWSERYEYDDRIPVAIGPTAKTRGYLTKPEFLQMTKWKTPRTQPRCADNSAAFVKAATSTALASRDERLRIEILTLLGGVQWPTASVMLHFCAKTPYPILDYRALWSLSCAVAPHDYRFALWEAYCTFTIHLADNAGVSMRTLDRALWQYSKENQSAGA